MRKVIERIRTKTYNQSLCLGEGHSFLEDKEEFRVHLHISCDNFEELSEAVTMLREKYCADILKVEGDEVDAVMIAETSTDAWAIVLTLRADGWLWQWNTSTYELQQQKSQYV